jgi:hypothetical protein
MKCIICGNEIIDPRQGKKYCNAVYCQNKNNQKIVRENSLKPILVKNCLNCGKRFETRRELQKNCSSACGEEHFAKISKIRNVGRNTEINRQYKARKKAKIDAELKGRSFAQALAEKYNLTLEAN